MSRACENYWKFLLLSHKLFSLCMASIISEYGVHMSLLSNLTEIEFFGWNFISMIMSMCTSIVCCRISGFWLCTHSLHHLWLSTEGSGVSSHPLWSEGVRRIGRPSAVRAGPRGPEPLCSRAPHSSRAGRLPTVQCFQFGGWMCCAPAEIVSWPVWWCCENGGTTFLIGA